MCPPVSENWLLKFFDLARIIYFVRRPLNSAFLTFRWPPNESPDSCLSGHGHPKAGATPQFPMHSALVSADVCPPSRTPVLRSVMWQGPDPTAPVTGCPRTLEGPSSQHIAAPGLRIVSPPRRMHSGRILNVLRQATRLLVQPDPAQCRPRLQGTLITVRALSSRDPATVQPPRPHHRLLQSVVDRVPGSAGAGLPQNAGF